MKEDMYFPILVECGHVCVGMSKYSKMPRAPPGMSDMFISVEE